MNKLKLLFTQLHPESSGLWTVVSLSRLSRHWSWSVMIPKLGEHSRRLLDSLPADPTGWNAMHSEKGELKVVCGPRCFPAISTFHSFTSRRRSKPEGGRGGTEGSQVELNKVVDGLRQQSRALLYGTARTCQNHADTVTTESLWSTCASLSYHWMIVQMI